MEDRGMALFILWVGRRQRWVLSFTPLPEKMKNHLPLLEIEPCFLTHVLWNNVCISIICLQCWTHIWSDRHFLFSWQHPIIVIILETLHSTSETFKSRTLCCRLCVNTVHATHTCNWGMLGDGMSMMKSGNRVDIESCSVFLLPLSLVVIYISFCFSVILALIVSLNFLQWTTYKNHSLSFKTKHLLIFEWSSEDTNWSPNFSGLPSPGTFDRCIHWSGCHFLPVVKKMVAIAGDF